MEESIKDILYDQLKEKETVDAARLLLKMERQEQEDKLRKELFGV